MDVLDPGTSGSQKWYFFLSGTCYFGTFPALSRTLAIIDIFSRNNRN